MARAEERRPLRREGPARPNGPDKNVVWKFKLPGIGACTPCVWGDKIFVTSADGDQIVVLCVGTDGKEKWKQKLSETGEKRYRNPSGADVSDANASCSTDGTHVWACASNGSLACFTMDGKPVWNTDLQKYGKYNIQFGCHWTPVLYKGKLYLQIMHRNTQKLVCLDGNTGKEEWAVDREGYVKVPSTVRMESPDVYASAFMWEGEGGPLLVAHGNDYTTGHKLTDGSEVWRMQGLNPTSNGAWRFVSCPLLTPDLIVVPSCKNGPTVGFNPVGAKGDIDPDNKAEICALAVDDHVPDAGRGHTHSRRRHHLLSPAMARYCGSRCQDRQATLCERNSPGSFIAVTWRRPTGRFTSSPPMASTDVVQAGRQVQEARDQRPARHGLLRPGPRRRPHLLPRLSLSLGHRDEVTV